jgi:uncharacterized protein YacL (UPF0231 family)
MKQNVFLLLCFVLFINLSAAVKGDENRIFYVFSQTEISGAENIFAEVKNTNSKYNKINKKSDDFKQSQHDTQICEEGKSFIFISENTEFTDENNIVFISNENLQTDFDIIENLVEEKPSFAFLKDKKLTEKISELKKQQENKPSKQYFSGENYSEHYFISAENSSLCAQISSNFKIKDSGIKETYKNPVHTFISRNTISKNNISILKNNHEKNFTVRPPPTEIPL